MKIISFIETHQRGAMWGVHLRPPRKIAFERRRIGGTKSREKPALGKIDKMGEEGREIGH